MAGRVVYRQSFVASTNPDDCGHGAQVAGIAAGDGAASGGAYRGVAPGAHLIDLRILDANGMSSDSVAIAVIDRAIALKNQYNIRAINLSIGRPIFESYTLNRLCAAVTAAWKKGIVVVGAAGNLGRNGYATITSPGNDPYAITVGAMKTEGTPQRSDDLIASFSSKGPTWIDFEVKPDIVAPGNLVHSLLAGSTLAKEFPGNISSPYYIQLSGTSMATPVVSGAAAVLLQQDPSLCPTPSRRG